MKVHLRNRLLKIEVNGDGIETLRMKQSRFARMLVLLLCYCELSGLKITLGDAWAHDGHMENSLHYIRLAIDLNFFRDGDYLIDTEDYRDAGEYWESIGGSWGGRFKDGNHFSLSYQGRK